MSRFERKLPPTAKTLSVEIYAMVLENAAGHAWVDKVVLPNCTSQDLDDLHREAELSDSEDCRATVVCFKGEIAMPKRLPRPIPQINLGEPQQTVLQTPDYEASETAWKARHSESTPPLKIAKPHKRRTAMPSTLKTKGGAA